MTKGESLPDQRDSDNLAKICDTIADVLGMDSQQVAVFANKKSSFDDRVLALYPDQVRENPGFIEEITRRSIGSEELFEAVSEAAWFGVMCPPNISSREAGELAVSAARSASTREQADIVLQSCRENEIPISLSLVRALYSMEKRVLQQEERAEINKAAILLLF
jgi:hypothetical protein